ncbi:hypothetical protein AK830_g4715 [Neonectria ditissima]|uniref:Major facilitator superfamily (MFS) profile domain-containing protein n=1 Tax=Neonectria ditissima TaxID=78410 RepID=A0A0P7B7L1_9HYPO|nr:hypothetical protein AK830_g4715 [Neonectria ditissima]
MEKIVPEAMDKSSTHNASSRSISGFDPHPTLGLITRKVDWHIVPLLLLCYLLQFLDKVLINYANTMGLSTSLDIQGNDFSWMATAFFIGYAVAEFPQGYLIQRFPISKVLGVNVFLWGVIICCSAAAQSFAGLTAARTLLGMLEAVITPALIMITSQWYTRQQATPRIGVWYCGLGLGQSIGGLISFAAQHGRTTGGFEGWRIMFVSVGAFNLLVGLLVTFWMPSGIQDAKFLTEEEKDILRDTLSTGQEGNGQKVFVAAGIWDALKDLHVWLLFFNTILIVIPSGVVTTFSATLIRGFGYDSKQAALLNMPSGVVSVSATLLSTFAILYKFPRWLGLCLLMAPALVGAGLMSFYTESKAGSLAGIYLINFIVAPLALIYALVGANIQGYTKRVTTNAMIAIAFSISNIVGPQTFQVKDAPDYIPAKITVLAVCGGSIVLSILTRLLYGSRNRKAMAALEGRVLDASEGTEEATTDRTNPHFVYVY